MEEVSCKGKTSTGAQCTRTTGLSKTGFCFQHAKQQQQQSRSKEGTGESEQHLVSDNVEEEIEDSSNVVIGPSKAQTPHPEKPEIFKKQQQPPPAAAKRTDTIINDNNSVEVISVDSRSNSQEGSSSNNKNNSSDNSQQAEDNELPRCTAIAATTKKRCKKFVSVAGEHHCPAHGGAQIRAKTMLPSCQALSAKIARHARTRSACRVRTFARIMVEDKEDFVKCSCKIRL